MRHPQYLGYAFFNLALVLIKQHWILVVLGPAAIAFFYVHTLREEQFCIDKFGDEYRRYMQAVPRFNFLLGILRAVKRRTRRA